MSDTNEITLIPKTPSEVAKAIVYIALTALAIFRTANADNLIVPAEWVGIILAVIGVVPVFLLAGTLVKTVAAFALAGGQALVLALGPALGWGAVSADAWFGVIFAAFAAIGIAVVPNKPMIDARTTNRVTSLGDTHPMT